MFGLSILFKLIKQSSKPYSVAAIVNKYSTIAATNAITDHRFVIVNFTNNLCQNERLKFPLVWLRDNCQCSMCFDALSKSRTIDWAKFQLSDATPKIVSVS